MISKAVSRDVPALAAIWADAEARRYLGGPISFDEAQSRVASRVVAGQLCAARLLGNAPIIGAIALEGQYPLKIEISYLFNVDAWGHGYATESVAAVIDKLRDKFNGYELIAKTQMVNLTSKRLLVRLGFQMEDQIVEFGELQAIYRQCL